MRYPMRLDKVWRPSLALFGGTPRQSYVELRPDGVRFRFGWWFDKTVPWAEIEEAQHASWSLLDGIGWRLTFGGVGLIGSLRGVVKVQLRTPRWLWLGPIPWRVSRIYVSLEEPETFLAELQRGTPAR